MKLKVLGASFALWSTFAVFGLKPGHLCLAGSRSDAPAHIDSAILLFYRGLGVYKQPLDRLGTRSVSETAKELTARYDWPTDGVSDLLDIPERAGKPPLMVNWSYLPRPYPPGVFLYFMPEAVLKEWFGFSTKAATTLALLQMLLAAHVFLWLFASLITPGKSDETSAELVRWVILPLVYCEAIYWTLHGFYDCAALIPLLLSIKALREKKAPLSVFWFSASLFLHFRSLWFLPLLGLGLARSVTARGPKPALLGFACAGLLALAGGAFLLVYPWIMTLKPTNYFFMTADPADWVHLAYLLAPLGLLGAALAQNRSWLVLACLTWATVMVARSPFVQMWHSFYLTPLLAMTGLGERSAGRGRLFVLLSYLVLASLAFTYFTFNGLFLSEVVKELWG